MGAGRGAAGKRPFHDRRPGAIQQALITNKTGHLIQCGPIGDDGKHCPGWPTEEAKGAAVMANVVYTAI
jgi:hypothetical protein